MISKKHELDGNAYFDMYLWANDTIRPAVVITPGGGYGFVAMEYEGEPLAMQFLANGYNVFVLNYTVPPCSHTQPLEELSNAMCIIREHCAEWHVDSERIAVMGFSAGGHLTASLGVFWQEERLKANGLNKPNAMILCYPVISSDERHYHGGSFENLLGADFNDSRLLDYYSLDKRVTKDTPPAFIWHTVEDEGVPVENALLMASALRSHNIPFELHIYPSGHHGLSLGTSISSPDEFSEHPHHVSSWLPLCLSWLSETFK